MSHLLTLFSLWQTLTVGLPAAAQAKPSPPTCGADAREPNDTRARARSTKRRSVEARVCAGDDDWFYFEAARGRPIDVRVAHAQGARLELHVYAPRHRKPVGPAVKGGRLTHVAFEPPKSGRYRVHITSTAPATTPYTLRVAQPARE